MLRRILNEQRRFLVPLAIVFALNVVVYAAVVHPLENRVGDASRRAAAADASRRAAQQELNAARSVATGKERAEAELKTFYQQVLPADLSAANRATYLTVAQLARKTNLQIIRREGAREDRRDETLGRWQVRVALLGAYEDIRRFIYELETTPTFVVIDQMAIGQGQDASKPLELSLSLSTYYYRAADNAS